MKYDAPYNMAIDEAITISVMKGKSPTTLRIYGWLNPSISIGAFQKIKDINLTHCNKMNIPIVRRPTGGRAILHENELTYSFSSNTSNNIFSNSLLENYRQIGNTFCYAFGILGIDAIMSNKRLKRNVLIKNPLCFQSTSYGEITVNGKKIIGSAQMRYKNSLLQQGSIPFSIDRNNLLKVFNVDNSLISQTYIDEISNNINIWDLLKATKDAFEKTFKIKFIIEDISNFERQKATELLKKYQSESWTFRR